jgi:hypothetical protein
VNEYDEAEDVDVDANLSDDDLPEPADPAQVPPDQGDIGSADETGEDDE